MKYLIDVALPSHKAERLAVPLLLMFAGYQGRSLLQSMGNYWNSRAANLLALRLRMRLTRHLFSLSPEYHESNPAGARLFLIGSIVKEIRDLGADLVPLVLRTLLSSCFVAAAMIFVNPRLAFAIFPFLPVFIWVNQRHKQKLRGAADAVQESERQYTATVQESMANAVQIQLLRAERCFTRYSLRQVVQLVRAELKRKRAEWLYVFVSGTIIVAAILTVLGYGGLQVIQGRMSVGGLVAFYGYLARLFEPLYMTVELRSRMERVGAAIRTVCDTLAMKPTVREAPDAITPRERTRGSLEMSEVSFRYRGGRTILRNLNLSIKSGEHVTVMGPVGAGKSTILRLAARLYDPYRGSVRLDKVDLRHLSLSYLRDQVIYLPQQAVLFDATLEENLLFGRLDAPRREIERVVELCALERLLRGLPLGWQESLGPQGGRLSGGQRQQLALARALLQRPGLLLLDEATASMDESTEELILRNLSSDLADTTLLIVSHRPAASRWTDRTLIIEDGCLAGEISSLRKVRLTGSEPQPQSQAFSE